jgi:hypothetical protein
MNKERNDSSLHSVDMKREQSPSSYHEITEAGE